MQQTFFAHNISVHIRDLIFMFGSKFHRKHSNIIYYQHQSHHIAVAWDPTWDEWTEQLMNEKCNHATNQNAISSTFNFGMDGMPSNDRRQFNKLRIYYHRYNVCTLCYTFMHIEGIEWYDFGGLLTVLFSGAYTSFNSCPLQSNWANYSEIELL